MEKFLEILVNYKAEIVSAAVFILGVITLCIKRRPKSVDEVLEIVHGVGCLVPYYVSAVEVPGDGDAKKTQVISMCISAVKKKLKRPLSNQEIVEFSDYFGQQVEAVLETPQKKGVSK